MSTLIDNVKSTMKCQDTEGPFELYVTRTPGYLWAIFFKAIGVHPIVVTLVSYVLGVAGGVLFYFEDLWLNLLGMFLLTWANWYDCADGQLARMTKKCTLIGRVLDGFGGDLWFFTIYVSIACRLWPTWGVWGFLVAALAGFHCHAQQAAIADYYRNIHMWVIFGKKGSELERTSKINAKMKSLGWTRDDWFNKIYLFFYSHYTQRQEKPTPKFQELYRVIEEKHDGEMPEEYLEEFRQKSLPLMPWTNVLTHDTRVAVLFLSLIVGMPWIYLVFEITVLEVIHVWIIRKHERICVEYIEKLRNDR